MLNLVDRINFLGFNCYYGFYGTGHLLKLLHLASALLVYALCLRWEVLLKIKAQLHSSPFYALTSFSFWFYFCGDLNTHGFVFADSKGTTTSKNKKKNRRRKDHQKTAPLNCSSCSNGTFLSNSVDVSKKVRVTFTFLSLDRLQVDCLGSYSFLKSPFNWHRETHAPCILVYVPIQF